MLNKTLTTIAHYIAPPYCAHCRQFMEMREPLCASCYDNIVPVVSTELEITASKSIRVFALSDYEDPLKKLILAKNYGNRIAPAYLAKIMIKNLPLQATTCDYLVPIPLHWTRLLRRGFNQAEIIAESIGKHGKKPVIKALYRSKRTPFQSTLNAEERTDNVQEAFKIIPDLPDLTGKSLLLIDDLMTTGATLRSATKLLLKCNPKNITALVACRKL